MESRLERIRVALARTLRQRGVDGPEFDRLEGVNLGLAVNYEPERDGLHSAGGKAAPHFLPQHGAELVADDAIQDAPRLLRVYERAV